MPKFGAIQSSEEKLRKIDEHLVEGYDLIGVDIQGALRRGHLALETSSAIKYKLGIADSYILLGACDSALGLYKEALKVLQEGLDLAHELENVDLLAKGLHTLGNVYYKFGDLESALAAYLQGLENARLGSGAYQVNLLNNISVVYAKTNQLDQSLGFLLEARSMEQESSRARGEEESAFYGFLLANIAEVHLKLGDLNQAQDFAFLAEGVLSRCPVNYQYQIQLLKIKGKIASNVGDGGAAIEAFNQAVKLCEYTEDLFRLCSITLEIGRHYVQGGQVSCAIQALLKAQTIGEGISADAELRDIAHMLGGCYEAQGNFEAALHQAKTFHKLYERINTRSLDNQLLTKTVMFEVEQAKKDAEILRLQTEEVHLIGKIGQIITATLDIKMVLRLIHKHIQSIVEVDAFGVCTVNYKEKIIEFKMMIENGKKQPLHHVSMDDPASLAARCIRERKVLLLQDLSTSTMPRKSWGTSMRSVIFFPLIVSDEVIGALTLQSLRPNAYPEKAQRLVSSLGAYIGIALKNSMQSADLARKSDELERLSQTDALTGLYNRRYMMLRLDEKWAQCERLGASFHLALLDSYYFKQINDRHGHHVGDAVLVELAALMVGRLRKYDVVARWGGEEFMILIPDRDSALATKVCERLRQAVAAHCVQQGELSIGFTVTIGLTRATASDANIDVVIQRADQALYAGKQTTRNCLVFR